MSEKVDPELGVHALEALVAANYCVGWNEAIEAAAELMAEVNSQMNAEQARQGLARAAAIRKLKKP